MLNCTEIIFLSQHHQSPFLSQSPTSVKLLASCLLIFSFRKQQEDGRSYPCRDVSSARSREHCKAPAAPQKHQYRTAISYFTVILLLYQRSETKTSQRRTKGRRGAGASCWGQRMQSSFLQCRKETLCSELMQLKMQIQTNPKSSQMHVRLVKEKGSWKGCLTKGSLTTGLTFIFKLTFLCEAIFQKFTHDPLL